MEDDKLRERIKSESSGRRAVSKLEPGPLAIATTMTGEGVVRRRS